MQLNRTMRGSVVLTAAALALLSCDSAPTEPGTVSMENGAASQMPLRVSSVESDSVEIVDSTFSEVRVGSTDVVTFSDTDGNDYRYEATWDASGQLVKLGTWLNGVHVGEDEVNWSAGHVTERDNYSSVGWVSTDANGTITGSDNYLDECSSDEPVEPDDGGIDNGSEGGGDEPLDKCDDDAEMQAVTPGLTPAPPSHRSSRAPPHPRHSGFTIASHGENCDDEWSEYQWSSVNLLIDVGVATGSTGIAIVNPEPVTKGLAALVAVGAWRDLARGAKRWWRAQDALGDCFEAMYAH